MDYLTKIYFRPFYIYRDEKSIEIDTGKQKPKYKLFWNFHRYFDEVLLFLISTKNEAAVSNGLYISVDSTEWKTNIDPKKFLTKTSFISIKKVQVENIEELKKKREQNTFYCVAQLPESKHNSITQCYLNFLKKQKNISSRDRNNLLSLTDCIPQQICIDDKTQEFINKYLKNA